MQLRRLYIIPLVYLAGCFHPAFSQKFNPYYNFRHLNVENGLANNIVYHFLQDSRGYMWLGTRSGITVFDGIRTINFQHEDQDKKSLAGNFITRILEDSSQRIWIGNNAGIDLFNPGDNSFTHYPIGMADGRMEDTYCVLLGFSNQDDLWFIDTKSKAVKIFNTRTGKFRPVLSTEAVDGMLVSQAGKGEMHIWTYLSIGTTHYVFHHDSLIREQHFFVNAKNQREPSLQIFHVYFQNDTAAWLSSSKGLIALNPVSGLYNIYNKMGATPVTESRYAALSSKEILWVGTGGNGIFTFNTLTKKFVEHFRNYALDPFSICSNNIVSLYFDNVGNIWSGSFGNGVSYTNVENNSFSKSLSKNEIDHGGKGNNVSWVGADRNHNVWCILQDAPVFWQLDSSLKITRVHQPLTENGKPFDGSVYQLYFDSKKTAWCLTNKGLYKYNTISEKMKLAVYPRMSKELFGSGWINQLICLHDSSLLFSTWGGLYRIMNQGGKSIILPFTILNKQPFKSFYSLYEDKEHNIYVRDVADSLYVLADPRATGDYLIKKSFGFHEYIMQFLEDSTEVLVATNAGFFRIDKNGFNLRQSNINALLPFRGVNSVLGDQNKLWVFGDKGLYYYNKGENKGRLFTVEDGLPSNNFSESPVVILPSGKCIAGTDNGLVSFYPNRIKDKIYPPRAQLINFYVNDSSKGFVPNPQEMSKIVLSYDQNTFSLDFSCISFQHAASCRYEYKLEGFDENWIKSGTRRYTRYSKIPPGNYRFRLRILDANGEVSPFMKSLAIEIKKAFWQTAIFKFIMVTLSAFLIWLLVKWYLTTRIRKQQVAFEKQQAIEKERTRIATDMHDDLGAGLSSIRFLSEKVRRNSFSDITKDDIDRIMDHSAELIDKMNEIVWAMNEKNDSLGDLLVYIRSYAKEYCEEHEIRCEIRLPENIPEVFVSGEVRRNVFLTIKESLHNIVKHANAREARIEFRINSGLFVSIRDDGKGFDISHHGKDIAGNGLKNMQKRIESVGGSFKIINGTGVVIEIEVPLSV